MTNQPGPFTSPQHARWTHFAAAASVTVPPAAQLVSFARLTPGARVLDVACGTGNVAVTAARAGARVSGLDITPALLDLARESAAIGDFVIDFREGDAEALPYEDESFDVVLSQFGHIFAPRQDVVTREMLRVLAKGGTIAFSTWPPELFGGRLTALMNTFTPPPPGASSPMSWGDPNIVRERLGSAVKDLTFDRATMRVPALSPRHHRVGMEQNAGPVITFVEQLAKEDPQKLARFRQSFEDLIAEFFDSNTVRQDFLMSRAMKV